MKNLATVISASVLAVASVSVSAYGYGYAPPYGYAPYGYGVPVQPPAQLTEEQIKAMQEQQARAFEYMQNVQRQMAQYYANNPDPIVSMERRMFEERNAHMQEMNKLIQETNQDMNRNIQESMSQPPVFGAEPALPEDVTARKQEMEKQAQEYRKAAEERRAVFMKAAEQRRLDAEKRFEERKMQRNSSVAPVVDVPKIVTSSEDAKKI
ncbi:MAG: hypothetical protein WCH04_07570 [Gammaproteobacteria bacterium]